MNTENEGGAKFVISAEGIKEVKGEEGASRAIMTLRVMHKMIELQDFAKKHPTLYKIKYSSARDWKCLTITHAINEAGERVEIAIIGGSDDNRATN